MLITHDLQSATNAETAELHCIYLVIYNYKDAFVKL